MKTISIKIILIFLVFSQLCHTQEIKIDPKIPQDHPIINERPLSQPHFYHRITSPIGFKEIVSPLTTPESSFLREPAKWKILDRFENLKKAGHSYNLQRDFIYLKERRIIKAGDRFFFTYEKKLPINAQYAGHAYPKEKLPKNIQEKYSGQVRFSVSGYPDFSPWVLYEVEPLGLNGKMPHDSILANKAVGIKKTPKDYIWHHHEGGKKMQCVPEVIHKNVPHSGGGEFLRNRP